MRPTALPIVELARLSQELSDLHSLCDGSRTVAELATQTGWPRELVWQRLDLLAGRVNLPSGVTRDSRRQILRRLTATAALAPAAAMAIAITPNSATVTAALSEQDKKEGRAKIDAANDQARALEQDRKATEANQEFAEKRMGAEQLRKTEARNDKAEQMSKSSDLNLIQQEALQEQNSKTTEDKRKMVAEKQAESDRKANRITDDEVQMEQSSKATERRQHESDAKVEEAGKAQESRNKEQDGAREDTQKLDFAAKENEAKLNVGANERRSKKLDLNQEQSAKLVYPVSLLDVPEPQSWTLVGLAIVGAAAVGARARQTAPAPDGVGADDGPNPR